METKELKGPSDAAPRPFKSPKTCGGGEEVGGGRQSDAALAGAQQGVIQNCVVD